MCKSKSDGGKRCFSHTAKDRASVARQLEKQIELLNFLSDREKAAGQLTLKQQEEQTMREEKVSELMGRADSLDEQLTQIEEDAEQRKIERAEAEERKKEQARIEAEARIKRGHQGEGKGRPRLNLTPNELTTLKEDALADGKTVSRYVQDLMDDEPHFLPKGADSDFKRLNTNPDWDKTGRKPQSKHGATISASPTAGMPADKYDRLTAEAEAFGLTTADYLRRRILGIDPRTRGSHMAVWRQEAEIDLLAHTEAEAGLGDNPSPQQLWDAYSARADEIQKARRKNKGKDKPIAA